MASSRVQSRTAEPYVTSPQTRPNRGRFRGGPPLRCRRDPRRPSSDRRARSRRRRCSPSPTSPRARRCRSATVPHVITAVETGRGRPRDRAHRELDRGLDLASPSTRSRSTPTCSCSARSTCRSRCNLCARTGHEARPTSRRCVSHPNPLGQCRMWLLRSSPTPSQVVANSTAEAAQQVAKSKRGGMAVDRQHAMARELHGLEMLAREIEDHPENQTRFVVVGHGIPAPTGHDKTTIVCFQREDRPGSLLAILPGVRGPRDQPHQARVAPDQARASATTASSSTSRATSTTSSSPTACATSRRSRPR